MSRDGTRGGSTRRVVVRVGTGGRVRPSGIVDPEGLWSVERTSTKDPEGRESLLSPGSR